MPTALKLAADAAKALGADGAAHSRFHLCKSADNRGPQRCARASDPHAPHAKALPQIWHAHLHCVGAHLRGVGAWFFFNPCFSCAFHVHFICISQTPRADACLGQPCTVTGPLVQQTQKNPSRGVFNWRSQQSLLNAGFVFGVFFFRAVDFFVVHFAAAMATGKGRCTDQHEGGDESGHNEFHRSTL